jgi:hypothetical protein
MSGDHGTGQAGAGGGRGSWPAAALLAVGGWLVVSPLILHTTRVTPGLVPIAPSDVIEPTRAIVARAEWSSILTGLVILALAGSALLAAARRRQDRSAPSADGGRHAGTGGERR